MYNNNIYSERLTHSDAKAIIINAVDSVFRSPAIHTASIQYKRSARIE